MFCGFGNKLAGKKWQISGTEALNGRCVFCAGGTSAFDRLV